MGVDRNLVIEAFLACDKNENMAASYILDRMDDMEQDPAGGDGGDGGDGGEGGFLG